MGNTRGRLLSVSNRVWTISERVFRRFVVADYIADGGGELIATENASGPCTTCYFGTDHLGSVRIVTDQNAKVVARHDYLPFGEELPGGMAGRTTPGFGAADLTTQRFTGQVRDSESGQDFFNARYFMAPLGRFNSADPGNAGASLLSSQSWNGYGYVLGNPLNSADPSGRGCASRSGLSAHTVGCSGGGNYGPEDGGVSIDGGASIAVGTFGSGNPAGGESGVRCPNNVCQGVTSEGQLYDISASASGAVFANLYWRQLIENCVVGESNDNFQCSWTHRSSVFVENGSQIGYFGNISQLFNANATLWSNTAGVGNSLTVATTAVAVDPLALEAAEAWATRAAWFRIPIPILNPAGVLGAAGQSASNCFTAACYGQGWVR